MDSDLIAWLDFDWEDYSNLHAKGGVRVLGITDEQAIANLIANNDIIENTFSYTDENSNILTFVADEINGMKVKPKSGKYHWVTDTIIEYLKLHPGAREFLLSGVIEW